MSKLENSTCHLDINDQHHTRPLTWTVAAQITVKVQRTNPMIPPTKWNWILISILFCNFGMGINRFLSNTKIRKWYGLGCFLWKYYFIKIHFHFFCAENNLHRYGYCGLNLLVSGNWLSWLILTNVLLNWNCIYRLQRGTVTLAHARRCDGRYIGVVSSRHVVLTELVSSVSTQHNIKTKKASVGTISIKKYCTIW